MKRNKVRRAVRVEEAKARQKAREKRSTKEQLALIAIRRGESRREVARLEKRNG